MTSKPIIANTSRSGSLTGDLTRFPLSCISQINWKKADIFNPASYSEELKQADAVVHSLGAIFDSDGYKKVLNGGISPKALLGVACDLTKQSFGSSNPLDKSAPNDGAFNRLNRDSAVLLAKEFVKAKQSDSQDTVTKQPFIYISAENHNPLIPRGYIESKREAEVLIQDVDGLRGVYLRPAFMYDQQDNTSIRTNIVRTLGLAQTVLERAGFGQLGESALPIQVVANAVVDALDDDTLEGPISLGALSKYAQAAN